MRVCDWQKLGISALLCLLLKDSVLGWKEFGHSLKSVHALPSGVTLSKSRPLQSHTVTQQNRVCSSYLQPGAGLRGELHISRVSGLGPRLMVGLSLLPCSTPWLERVSVSIDTAEAHWPGRGHKDSLARPYYLPVCPPLLPIHFPESRSSS